MQHRALVDSSRIDIARLLADEVIEAWTLVQQIPSSHSMDAVHLKLEELITFLETAFPGTISIGEAQKIILEEGDKLSEMYLETLRPAAVPLSIIRGLLADCNVQFDVRFVPSWRAFVQRYATQIVATI